MRENFQEFIEYLQGTCMSLDEAIVGFFDGDDLDSFDLTEDEFQAIDDQIFRCESCSWWCEVGEDDEEGNCQDCHEGL